MPEINDNNYKLALIACQFHFWIAVFLVAWVAMKHPRQSSLEKDKAEEKHRITMRELSQKREEPGWWQNEIHFPSTLVRLQRDGALPCTEFPWSLVPTLTDRQAHPLAKTSERVFADLAFEIHIFLCFEGSLIINVEPVPGTLLSIKGDSCLGVSPRNIKWISLKLPLRILFNHAR